MTWIAYTVSGASYEVTNENVEVVLAGTGRFIKGVAKVAISVDLPLVPHKAHIAVQHIVALEEQPE